MTKDEYEELFRRDENECYVNLIIPAMGEYPEMNLIGKRPEEYTLDEIVHSKVYKRQMFEEIE